MKQTPKLTPIAQAYQRANPARDALRKISRCMEVTEDKAGLLWERWMVKGTSVVVVATPYWAEVFTPITDDPEWENTIEAIAALAK